MHEDNDKRMRVNSDVPNAAAYSGRLTTAPQRPGPALQYLNKKRYTPLRVIEFIEFKLLNSTNSYHEEACISEEKTLKEKP